MLPACLHFHAAVLIATLPFEPPVHTYAAQPCTHACTPAPLATLAMCVQAQALLLLLTLCTLVRLTQSL